MWNLVNVMANEIAFLNILIFLEAIIKKLLIINLKNFIITCFHVIKLYPSYFISNFKITIWWNCCTFILLGSNSNVNSCIYCYNFR